MSFNRVKSHTIYSSEGESFADILDSHKFNNFPVSCNVLTHAVASSYGKKLGHCRPFLFFMEVTFPITIIENAKFLSGSDGVKRLQQYITSLGMKTGLILSKLKESYYFGLFRWNEFYVVLITELGRFSPDQCPTAYLFPKYGLAEFNQAYCRWEPPPPPASFYCFDITVFFIVFNGYLQT